MSKFKRGDKVISTCSNSSIDKGTIGMVQEDSSKYPWVEWNDKFCTRSTHWEGAMEKWEGDKKISYNNIQNTKYLTLPGISKPTEPKLTTFTHSLDIDKQLFEVQLEPTDWDNVLWLGCDKSYGDMFKCWDNSDINEFTLVFGTKGDEFNA